MIRYILVYIKRGPIAVTDTDCDVEVFTYIYNFMYDIIGMNYDIIAYDIIVNIIPVISWTLHFQGPWPAFAGQPYLSCMYIQIKSNWIITAMSM